MTKRKALMAIGLTVAFFLLQYPVYALIVLAGRL